MGPEYGSDAVKQQQREIVEEGGRRYADVAEVWRKYNGLAPHELGLEHVLWLAIAQLEHAVITWEGRVPVQLALCVFLLRLVDKMMDPEQASQCSHAPDRFHLEMPARKEN